MISKEQERWRRMEWEADNPGMAYPSTEQDPVKFLEESAILWKRDWDALVVGFVVGVLATLAWVGL